MRRSSIIGPILLVGIGVLFLFNNLRPEIPLLSLIATYWPYVLILWGALRLVEILFWAASNKPLPAQGISGGAWGLIALMAFSGSGLFFVHERGAPWTRWSRFKMGMELFGDPFDFAIPSQRVPAKGVTRLLVENGRGNTKIVGVDAGSGGTVEVTGRKTVRSLKRDEAEEADRVTPLEVITNGDLMIVRTNGEKWREEQNVAVDLEITVPRGFSIEGRGHKGDFDITGVTGNVDIQSDNAGVRLEDIGGGVRVDLRRSDIVRAVKVKGNVEVKGRGDDLELDSVGGQVTVDGSYSGDLDFRNLAKPFRFQSLQTDLRVERCPGQIRIARGDLHAEDVVGPMVIRAKSKDVTIDGLSDALSVNLDRGDVEIRPGRIALGKMDVVTRSGQIDLALPEGADFDLRATARRGDVENEFGSPLEVSNEGRGGAITGRVGNGPALVLSSDRGSVTVTKGSVKIEAPAPPLIPAPPTSPRRAESFNERVDRHAEKIGTEFERAGKKIEKDFDRAGKKIEAAAERLSRRL